MSHGLLTEILIENKPFSIKNEEGDWMGAILHIIFCQHQDQIENRNGLPWLEKILILNNKLAFIGEKKTHKLFRYYTMNYLHHGESIFPNLSSCMKLQLKYNKVEDSAFFLGGFEKMFLRLWPQEK
jgi:hypothetical protein